MVALKITATGILLVAILTEALGAHPGGWGFVSNAGVVLAVVLWVVSSFGRVTCIEEKRR